MEKMLTWRLSSVTQNKRGNGEGGRERGIGRGLKRGGGGEGGEGKGGECLLWLSVKNVSPLCAVSEDREKRGSFEKRGEKKRCV